MFSDPLKNLKAIALRENEIVADLGAGSGFYTLMAGSILPLGKVYAVEIHPEFVSTLRNKIKDSNLKNIEVILGDLEKSGGSKIADKVVDVVLMSNVLSQIENKNKAIFEAWRILKPRGRLLFIDWLESHFKNSPLGISKNKSRELFEKNNFIFEREIDVGLYHYGMIFNKE